MEKKILFSPWHFLLSALTYTLTMFNQEDQRVMNQIIQHEGGNGV